MRSNKNIVIFLVVAYPFLIAFACQAPEPIAMSNSQNATPILPDETKTEEPEDEKGISQSQWLNFQTEDCLSKVDIGEPIELVPWANPVYLRANFDSNDEMDYAVLVRVKNTNKNGVVICKDGIKPYVFGAIAPGKELLGNFENDNFITDSWSINSKKETKKGFNNGTKEGLDAKGESIGFYFDGGAAFIYWNGKKFIVTEGA